MQYHFYPEGSAKRLCGSIHIEGPEERRNPAEHHCKTCERIIVSRETLHK